MKRPYPQLFTDWVRNSVTCWCSVCGEQKRAHVGGFIEAQVWFADHLILHRESLEEYAARMLAAASARAGHHEIWSYCLPGAEGSVTLDDLRRAAELAKAALAAERN